MVVGAIVLVPGHASGQLIQGASVKERGITVRGGGQPNGMAVERLKYSLPRGPGMLCIQADIGVAGGRGVYSSGGDPRHAK